MSNLKNIPINEIVMNQMKLRSVDTESTSFQELVASIALHGVLSPVTVREVNQDGQTDYQLVDGLQRYTAARQAGLESVPCNIVAANDITMLEIQLQANAVRVETKPAEYAAQIKLILMNSPTLSESELAKRLAKSPTWINNILKLNDIKSERIRGKIDSGELPMYSAIQLARLPVEDHEEFFDIAMTKSVQEFMADVTTRLKANQEAKRQARSTIEVGFVNVPKLRPLAVMKAALEAVPSIYNEHCAGITDPIAAFECGLKYAITSTDVDVAAKARAFDEAQAAKAAKEAERKAAKELAAATKLAA